MDEETKKVDPSDVLSGTLNIFGVEIDLGALLTSPEGVQDRLGELRERLKQAGGKEVLSDDEWRAGGVGVTGHIRTRGLLGEREFHIGATGERRRRERGKPAEEAPEAVEPPVDVFDEEEQVIILADVPGASSEDLELKVEGSTFFLSTRATALRSYRKALHIEADLEPDSLKATCHNGVLEVRVLKRRKGEQQTKP